jgi:hypothetical protein
MGVYPEAVPEEMFVHNLEHGAVVLLYRCAAPCAAVVRDLTAIVQTLPPSKIGPREGGPDLQ